MVIDTEHLIGLREIAAIAECSRTAVSNWAKRFADFPNPVVTLERGSAWDRRDILVWLQAHGKIPFGKGMELHQRWIQSDDMSGS